MSAASENEMHVHDASKNVSPFKAATAAMICSGVEFYDVTLFAIFSMSIGRAYFPNATPQLEMFATLAVFSASFLARPFGSAIIGIYADRYGRKSALTLTAGAMAAATAVIGCMPAYSEVGWIAPASILLARLVQGFAFGGEVGPSTAYVFEIAPQNRRNLYASWQPAGQGVATMIAALFGLALTALLSRSALDHWGWRVPFIIGSLALWLVLIYRKNMVETLPVVFEDTKQQALRPILELVRRHPSTLLAIATQIAFGAVAIYICTYMNVYFSGVLNLSEATSFAATAAAGLSICIGSLAGGAIADAYGSRAVVWWSRLLLLVVIYPLFAAAETLAGGALLVSTVFPFLAMISAGASFGTITEALPIELRSTGLSMTYALVVCIFGGTLPFLLSILITWSGDPLVPAYLMVVASLIGLAGARWLGSRVGVAVAATATQNHHRLSRRRR